MHFDGIQSCNDLLLFVLAAVHETSHWTTAKIHAIRALIDSAAQHMRDRAPKIYSRELVDALFVQPYCRIQNLVEAGIAKRQTASVYLKQLVDIGMLRELKVGRDKLFVHPNFLRLISADDHALPAYVVPR